MIILLIMAIIVSPKTTQAQLSFPKRKRPHTGGRLNNQTTRSDVCGAHYEHARNRFGKVMWNDTATRSTPLTVLQHHCRTTISIFHLLFDLLRLIRKDCCCYASTHLTRFTIGNSRIKSLNHVDTKQLKQRHLD